MLCNLPFRVSRFGLFVGGVTVRVFCGPILAVAAVLAASASVQATPIVSNGDFETNAALFNTIPGYVGGANPAAIDSWTTTSAFSGLNGPGIGASISHANNGGDTSVVAFAQEGALLQAISGFTVNGLYKLDFDYNSRTGFPDAPPELNVTIGDLNFNTGPIIPVDSLFVFTIPYHHASLIFTALNAIETLTFIRTTPPGNASTLIDNVVISLVPEPSTLALAGLGLIALVGRGLRRRWA